MGMATSIDEYDDMLEDEIGGKKILIEGDSWVSHPLVVNLAGQIEKLGNNNFQILNLSVPGDTSINILNRHGSQFEELQKVLVDGQFSYDFDMILLSAGGNDIVGPEVRYFVDKKQNGKIGRELLNNFFRDVLGYIRSDYERFLDLLKLSPTNKNTPVITHAYSKLAPRPKGTHLFGHMFNKGWLSIYLSDKGISDPDEMNDLAAGMLEAFRDELLAIQSPNFLVVDTLDILMKDGKPDTSLFYDEIHPTSKGFRLVAEEIQQVAKSKNFWP